MRENFYYTIVFWHANNKIGLKYKDKVSYLARKALQSNLLCRCTEMNLRGQRKSLHSCMDCLYNRWCSRGSVSRRNPDHKYTVLRCSALYLRRVRQGCSNTPVLRRLKGRSLWVPSSFFLAIEVDNDNNSQFECWSTELRCDKDQDCSDLDQFHNFCPCIQLDTRIHRHLQGRDTRLHFDRDAMNTRRCRFRNPCPSSPVYTSSGSHWQDRYIKPRADTGPRNRWCFEYSFYQ